MTSSPNFLTYPRSVSAPIFFIQEDEAKTLGGAQQIKFGTSADHKHRMMFRVQPSLEEALPDRAETLKHFLAFCALVTQF
jgi:hypothetical protein